MSSTHIVLIGAGRIGGALAKVLETSQSQPEVALWDADLSRVPHQEPFEELVHKADIILLCTPSWTIRALAQQLHEIIRPNCVVIALSKGLDQETQQSVDEVLQAALPPDQQFGLLYGPMLSEELETGLLGVGVFATARAETFEILDRLFAGTNLKLVYERDVHSVGYCGVLKNVYAISLGIANGLNWGSNAKGWLVTHALTEMQMILTQLTGNPQVVAGVAGLSDLVATGFSPFSRNNQTGKKLVDGTPIEHKGEGFVSLGSLIALLDNDTSRFPLLSALRAVILEHASAKETFESLEQNAQNSCELVGLCAYVRHS